MLTGRLLRQLLAATAQSLLPLLPLLLLHLAPLLHLLLLPHQLQHQHPLLPPR